MSPMMALVCLEKAERLFISQNTKCERRNEGTAPKPLDQINITDGRCQDPFDRSGCLFKNEISRATYINISLF